MSERRKTITLVVGDHEFPINPQTDPEAQQIIREVARLGGWDQFKKALSTGHHEEAIEL